MLYCLQKDFPFCCRTGGIPIKAHGEKAILELLVQTRPEETVELESEQGHVKMIPFSGIAEGELFQGVIEPCGVDTQVTDACGVRHMSARYMLTGTDYTGAHCRIYVENDGWFTNGERPKPWHSVPRFVTNSAALAPILHRSGFVGEGLRQEDGLHICFYKIKHTEE